MGFLLLVRSYFIITNILGKLGISRIEKKFLRFFLYRTFLWETTDPLLRPLLLSFPAFCRNPADLSIFLKIRFLHTVEFAGTIWCHHDCMKEGTAVYASYRTGGAEIPQNCGMSPTCAATGKPAAPDPPPWASTSRRPSAALAWTTGTWWRLLIARIWRTFSAAAPRQMDRGHHRAPRSYQEARFTADGCSSADRCSSVPAASGLQSGTGTAASACPWSARPSRT